MPASVRDVVVKTGIVDAGSHYIVASGEADLACRITHIPKDIFAVTKQSSAEFVGAVD